MNKAALLHTMFDAYLHRRLMRVLLLVVYAVPFTNRHMARRKFFSLLTDHEIDSSQFSFHFFFFISFESYLELKCFIDESYSMQIHLGHIIFLEFKHQPQTELSRKQVIYRSWTILGSSLLGRDLDHTSSLILWKQGLWSFGLDHPLVLLLNMFLEPFGFCIFRLYEPCFGCASLP